MRGGFEELKALDVNVVYDEIHVAQSVLKNIINKNFEKLKPVQTKGIITVLENSYNLDLSDWTTEYNAYLESLQPKAQTLDKLALESKNSKRQNFPKIWIVLPLILLFIGSLVVSLKDSSQADINETNLTNEINETNLSMLLNAPLESNITSISDNNTTELNATLAPALNLQTEINTTAAAPSGTVRFEFTPKRKLWLGIYYLNEDNKSDFKDGLNATVQLNSLRPQIIRTGPSFFTIKLGDTIIESNTEKPARYLYDPKEKKIRSITQEEFDVLRPSKKTTTLNKE